MIKDTFHGDFVLATNEFLCENKMTQKDFCEKCGISIVTLKRILNGENISLKTMSAVTEVTGIPLTETHKNFFLHMIIHL